MSLLGHDPKGSCRAHLVRTSPESGLKSDIAPCPFRAKKRHLANCGVHGVGYSLM